MGQGKLKVLLWGNGELQMLNHKYTSQLQLLISVKRMLSNGIQVDLSDFNAVQRKWLKNHNRQQKNTSIFAWNTTMQQLVNKEWPE